jgi:hypothetical protein
LNPPENAVVLCVDEKSQIQGACQLGCVNVVLNGSDWAGSRPGEDDLELVECCGPAVVQQRKLQYCSP